MSQINGIVIKSSDYGESNKRVTLLSPQGKFVVVFKGVKKPKAKLAFAAEPFCFGNFEYTPTKTFPIVTGIDCIDQFLPLGQNLEKLYLASAFSEYVSKVVYEGQSSEEEFLFFAKALAAICYEDVNLNLLAIKLLFNAAKSFAYGVNLECKCSSCGGSFSQNVGFDLEGGHFICENCASSTFSVKVFDLVKDLSELSVHDINDKYGENMPEKSVIKIAINLLNCFLSYKTSVVCENFKQYLMLS